ncbi:phosphoribosylanthranilate isomerase [bacterium]|jgi:phosphoribosylanthranilate isomerase|nr:phosphoribosylanthranilate isomerase [bacterium]MBT3795427.1 phosphoribosylanthranilate isomerase [bacterium]MBT4634006.1 phosphoribosylanthranilate isomerase [bacterium]
MNKVKICGLTKLDDAILCAKLKVDFVGFIFYKPSPRFIEVKRAKTICNALSKYPIKKVGVFVDEEHFRINKIAKELSLDYVQLHGNESPSFTNKIKCKTIKAFSVSSVANNDYTKYNVDYLLFDTFNKELRGGTGKTFDWKLISGVVNREDIILSGGLSIENINSAIKESNTSFFDICSGVEESPGIKDVKKLETIVRLIKL